MRISRAARTFLPLGLALATACGGGGSSSPATTLSFASASGSTTEGAGPLAVQVVLHTSLASLAADASVDVVDLGTGTAVSGTDYAALGATVTFPAGSVDGATLSVDLDASADLTVEGGPETVHLGLANAVGGALGPVRTFTASLVDAEQATVRFAAAAGNTADESAASRSVSVELGLPPGVSLGVDASARVSDLGTGSATSGSDYAAFAAQTVTFPAGSADGATQTVEVQVLPDGVVELDETVDLGLSSPSGGTVIGATDAFELTISDDDSGGPAALLASEGPTGVENPLAYDELIDLGSQAVGAGPNAGTRVRVANAGGASMTLGAPRLSGAHANDFAVEVELAPLEPPDLPGPDAPVADLESPLVVAPAVPRASDPGGIAIGLDPDKLTELSGVSRATLHGFPVPGTSGLTLEVRRLPLPFTKDAVLRVDGVDVRGGPCAVLGDLSVWTGGVLELPGSRVFLALSAGGSRGFLELPFGENRIVHFATGADALGRAVDDRDLLALGFRTPPAACQEPLVPPGRVPRLASGPEAGPGADDLTAADCSVAIETDYQLYQKFGSVPATTTYVTELLAAISDRYFTDVQATLSIAYLGIHSNASDPWTSQDSGGNASALLSEFRGAWAPNQWPVQANLAHFVSGANLGGGIAYLDVLCDSSFGFGVSGNISGNIDWGTWTGQPGNFTWDFMVVAHEIGHNFAAPHTHSLCPPLDHCAANCDGSTVCSQGTLMSYCHTCGGMDNIDLEFHPVSANIMRQAANGSCLGLSGLAGGDWVQYLVRFNPMTTAGQRDASLEFEHDATNETQPFRIRLRGTGN